MKRKQCRCTARACGGSGEGVARPEEQRVLWGSYCDPLGWGRVSGDGGVTRAVCRRRISGESHGLVHIEGMVHEGRGGMHSAWFGTSEFGVSVEHPHGDG